MSEGDPED